MNLIVNNESSTRYLFSELKRVGIIPSDEKKR